MTRRNPYARHWSRPGPAPPRGRCMSYDRLLERIRAERHDCPYCHAVVGVTCVNPATGTPLAFLPAHLARTRLADAPPRRPMPDTAAPIAAARYRKKPVEVQAAQLDDDNYAAIAHWIGDHGGRTAVEVRQGHASLWIPTLEGDHRADRGDWIIRGIQGEFYPCKPDIFAATYEPVTADSREPTP